jgi:hypothetical protein
VISFRGKTTVVSRVICERVHGPPPQGKTDAAHWCGNRACVNPRHLRWATRKENLADELIHGTRNAKLTEADVLAIRRQPERTGPDLAAEFGITRQAVHQVRTHQIWNWLQ